MTTGISNRAWRNWWQLGLVLTSALLGHDVLMAAAGAATHETIDAHHGTVVADSPANDQTPTHPRGCGIVRSAFAPAGDQPEPACPSAFATIAIWPTPPFAHSPMLEWEEPAWPPGVRRALLQVYRI